MTDDDFARKEAEMQALLDTIEDMCDAADYKFAIAIESQCGRYGAVAGTDEAVEEGLALATRGYQHVIDAKNKGEVQ